MLPLLCERDPDLVLDRVAGYGDDHYPGEGRRDTETIDGRSQLRHDTIPMLQIPVDNVCEMREAFRVNRFTTAGSSN